MDNFFKNMYFTFGSMKLMIDCLQKQSIFTFEQIRQSDPSFLLLLKHHGRHINVNDVFHTVKRWRKPQKNVKFININDEVFLSPMRHDSLD